MAETITAAAIVAERPDLQPTGEAYVELAMTGAIVAGETPHARRTVASFLQALLNRAPLLAGEAYGPHRAILGALCLELEAAAIRGALDEPPGPLTDLRDPQLVARERELIASTQQWAEHQRARHTEAYRERVDDMLAVSQASHERADERLGDAVRQAEAFLASETEEARDAASLFA